MGDKSFFSHRGRRRFFSKVDKVDKKSTKATKGGKRRQGENRTMTGDMRRHTKKNSDNSGRFHDIDLSKPAPNRFCFRIWCPVLLFSASVHLLTMPPATTTRTGRPPTTRIPRRLVVVSPKSLPSICHQDRASHRNWMPCMLRYRNRNLIA